MVDLAPNRKKNVTFHIASRQIMVSLFNRHLTLGFDDHQGALSEARNHNGINLLSDSSGPLFRGRWRDKEGEAREFDTTMASQVVVSREDNTLGEQALSMRFVGLPGNVTEVVVRIRLPEESPLSYWSISAESHGSGYLEWLQFPVVMVPNDLPAQGGEGRIFWPALEGVVIEDAGARDRSHLAYQPVEYPNSGWCGYYPGCAPMQFLAYYRATGGGLYLATLDPAHSTKEIEYRACGDAIELIMKTFPGAPGAGVFHLPFETALGVFEGDWQNAAEIYRDWALANLPHLPPRLVENPEIPAWITKSPVVVTYPVTGVGHHSGPTQPNSYFPFTEALHHLEKLADDFDSHLLALLMHWEGTAPWAPPYVWPPLGGARGLEKFAEALHKSGHHLGLYCSGLAWTNTADTGPGNYARTEQFEKNNLVAEMCRGPQGEYECLICNGEGIRLGYDMCATSDFACKVTLDEAGKIAASGVDYIQLLDQNLGGAAYQCHDPAHGHPPAPGPWQPQAMRALLERVRDSLAEDGHGDVILGCEAAAAESFLDQLPVNDLRFHMGWWFGRPVPAFSYIFHEYCANFMGNQVEAMVLLDREKSPDNLFLRLAYSFAAGDMLTAVLADHGDIHWSWCTKWEVPVPEQKPLREFIRHLNAWRRGPGKDFLVFGRMEKSPEIRGAEVIPLKLTDGRSLDYPAVLSSCWRAPESGSTVLFLVNYSAREQRIQWPAGFDSATTLDGSAVKASKTGLRIPPRTAVMAVSTS
jgi:hypothetical protein